MLLNKYLQINSHQLKKINPNPEWRADFKRLVACNNRFSFVQRLVDRRSAVYVTVLEQKFGNGSGIQEKYLESNGVLRMPPQHRGIFEFLDSEHLKDMQQYLSLETVPDHPEQYIFQIFCIRTYEKFPYMNYELVKLLVKEYLTYRAEIQALLSE